MKKLALILLLLVFIPVTGIAKEVKLQVDFTFESSIEVDIDKYILYFTYLSETKQIIMDVTDLSSRTFDSIPLDLPVGKTINLYMSAIYKSGIESFSDPYPYKIIGKPTIINVRSIK